EIGLAVLVTIDELGERVPLAIAAVALLAAGLTLSLNPLRQSELVANEGATFLEVVARKRIDDEAFVVVLAELHRQAAIVFAMPRPRTQPAVAVDVAAEPLGHLLER